MTRSKDNPSVEPISPGPPRAVRAVTQRQDWRDVVFLHWEVSPDQAQEHLPDGVEPDLFEDRTYVGLIGLGIKVALLGAVAVPYVSTFPEINVRLYSVDRHGRRGIVFRSLDAGRLMPTLAARTAYNLPYKWWDGAATRSGNLVSYAGRRRWPGGGPQTRFAVHTGPPLERPTPLDHFLTARWVLHWSMFGRTMWCAAEHEPWPLHHAELAECSDDLVSAAGLETGGNGPVHVLWSPGVSAKIGPPRPV